MTLAEYGEAGVGPVRGPRARRQRSPVAVTRFGPGSLDPPIPQGGLGRHPAESSSAREPGPALERRRRLALMARPRASHRADPGLTVFRETH
jgi:hypothetical protein